MKDNVNQEHIFIDDQPKRCFCFPMFDLFKRKSKRNKVNSLPNPPTLKSNSRDEENQATDVQKSQPMSFPKIRTLFLDITEDERKSLYQLCLDPSIICVVSQNPIKLHFPLETIIVNDGGQIGSILHLRPFSVGHILIENGFEKYKPQVLFSLKQVISIKLMDIEAVEEAIKQWENFVISEFKNSLLKNILEKLMLRITIIGKNYWITLNQAAQSQDLAHQYYWENIGLSQEEDWNIIRNVYQYITLAELISLIQNKINQPHQFTKNHIKELLSKKMPQSLYLSPSEKVCSKSSSPENSGLFLPDGKSLSKSEEFDEDRMSSDVFMSVNEEEEPILKEIPSLKRKFRSFSLQGDKKEYLEYKKKYENIEDELEEYE